MEEFGRIFRLSHMNKSSKLSHILRRSLKDVFFSVSSVLSTVVRTAQSD